MPRHRIALLIVTGFALASGCSGPTEPPTADAQGAEPAKAIVPIQGEKGSGPYTSPPVVTGICMTDEFGNHLGGWGKPSGSCGAYPNPLTSTCTMHLAVRYYTHILVWVERAYGPGEPLPEATGTQVTGGATVFSGYSSAVAVLFDGVLEPGVCSIPWYGTTDAGDPAPSGFYRIYATLEDIDGVYWTDVLLARDDGDLPPGM
jgi:hypothetical protein